MALKGTLKDFGIADIFQLIGQQTKTGVLHLKSRDAEVHIAFSNGNIVRADSASRRQRDLLGSMLLNARMISSLQLDEALDVQRRTLQRLGDILIEKRFISAAQLKSMYQLQVTETIYRLFGWKTGTYEFEQGAVEFDAEMVNPIRSETVLMEGFRRVDEWPSIRRVISSPEVTFDRLKPMPARIGADHAADEEESDDAFGSPRRGGKAAAGGTIGMAERQAYEFADPGVTAERIGDLTRLGEFETQKALLNLINAGYLRVKAEATEKALESARATVVRVGDKLWLWTIRVAVTLLVVGVIGLLAYLLDAQRVKGGDTSELADETAQHLVAPLQRQRLADALAVYRLEKGLYPPNLDELVHAGMVRREELSYPFGTSFFYRRTAEGAYVLLAPIR